MNSIPAVNRIILARYSLAHAAPLIHRAQRYAANGGDVSRRLSRYLLAQARNIIAEARKVYADALAELAQSGMLTHQYARTYGGWRAVAAQSDACKHVFPRVYGKRQSAQRAAAAHIKRLQTSAACAKAVS